MPHPRPCLRITEGKSTIAVQVVIGLLLLVFSLIKLVRLWRKAAFNDLWKNKISLFNGGVLIFALSFIVGSLLKQWGIYYAASVVSALLFGGSVMLDAKEVHRYYEKLIPFIKEDIIDGVVFSEFSKAKLMEMLGCLGKGNLNTMIVLKIREGRSEPFRDLKTMNEVLRIVGRRFEESLSEECFLPLPLSHGRIGVAVRMPEDNAGEPSGARRAALWEILEGINADLRRNLKCDVAIGIGRSYRGLDDLRVSYHEALTAQEYAERLEASSIVHVENINLPD
ncbi:MAG: hypothetical protein NT061_03845 [Spirochaetes bacterium]|nr:hypothetical protein [Spirochaetota bacterium]